MQAAPIFVRFIFRHAWLMFVAITCINVSYVKIQSRRHIRERPELAGGYQRLVRGYLFWGNLPWIVMGVGLELGGLPSIISYFRPRDGNPFVLAFFGVVIAQWVLGFWWLFFARGAQFLVEHPGVFRGSPRSPNIIRLFYCLSVSGGIIAVFVMWFSDIPMFIQ
jgi:hypothetical protein